MMEVNRQRKLQPLAILPCEKNSNLSYCKTRPQRRLFSSISDLTPIFGVPGELADPVLQLFSGQTVIARNDNWRTTDPLCGSPAVSCGGEIEIVATGLDPCQPIELPGQPPTPTGCIQESVVLVTLPPGPYTAIVSGGTGVGLVEVFEVNGAP